MPSTTRYLTRPKQDSRPPLPLASKQGNRTGTSTPTSRRPQCTHMTMNRLYGPHACHMCGLIPRLGWVYVCAQDRLLRPSPSTIPMEETLPLVDDHASYFETQAQVARSIGLSESVVSQMRAGEYTFDQMEFLLKQRRHVVDLINKAQGSPTPSQSSRSTDTPTKMRDPAQSVIAHAGMAVAPEKHAGSARTLTAPSHTSSEARAQPLFTWGDRPPRSTLAKNDSCSFQACHTCRTFLSDRLYMSFESVLEGDMPAVTDFEVSGLKLMDADIVRNWDLHPAPPTNFDFTDDEYADADAVTIDGERFLTAHSEISRSVTPIDDSSLDSDSTDFEESNLYSSTEHSPGSTTNDISALINEYSNGQRTTTTLLPPVKTDFADKGTSPSSTTPRPTLQTRNPSSTSTSSLSLSDHNLSPLTPSAADFAQDLTTRLASAGDRRSGVRMPGSFPSRLSPWDMQSLSLTDLHTTHRGLPRKESSSSLGVELEVDGGLALTEEAVETGTPDIVTAP